VALLRIGILWASIKPLEAVKNKKKLASMGLVITIQWSGFANTL